MILLLFQVCTVDFGDNSHVGLISKIQVSALVFPHDFHLYIQHRYVGGNFRVLLNVSPF